MIEGGGGVNRSKYPTGLLQRKPPDHTDWCWYKTFEQCWPSLPVLPVGRRRWLHPPDWGTGRRLRRRDDEKWWWFPSSWPVWLPVWCGEVSSALSCAGWPWYFWVILLSRARDSTTLWERCKSALAFSVALFQA